MQDSATLLPPGALELREREISFPAVIVCDEATAALKVAGLPLLDRLLVAAHRAGATGISVVSSNVLPRLPRTTALGIGFLLVADAPTIAQPTLVLSTRLLVQAPDLKALMRNRGRLVARDGIPLPAGVTTEPLAEDLEENLQRLPSVVAQGVAEPIIGAASLPAASRALWRSLGSASDGIVDKYFNRPVGRIVSKQLVHTSVSPNQVSMAALLLGLVSAWMFASGTREAAIPGAIVLQLSAILDTVDGDLARVMFKESALGKWLDIVSDQVVHFAVFAAIGIGLYRAGNVAPVLALAASAGIGVVVSFAVVVRGSRQLERSRNPRLQKLIESTANRDFSIILVVMALFDKLDWFLWMSAVGVHIFWVAALVAQKTRFPGPDRTECAP